MEQNNKYELVKYVDGEFELEINVSPKEETIWMTANQMALLFDKDEKQSENTLITYLEMVN